MALQDPTVSSTAVIWQHEVVGIWSNFSQDLCRQIETFHGNDRHADISFNGAAHVIFFELGIMYPRTTNGYPNVVYGIRRLV